MNPISLIGLGMTTGYCIYDALIAQRWEAVALLALAASHQVYVLMRAP